VVHENGLDEFHDEPAEDDAKVFGGAWGGRVPLWCSLVARLKDGECNAVGVCRLVLVKINNLFVLFSASTCGRCLWLGFLRFLFKHEGNEDNE
jgi:hypothetical protein